MNKDNDNSSFELSVIDNTSSESGGTAEVSLKLSSAPFDTGTDSINSASGDIATVRINVQIDNISEARIDSLNGTQTKTLVFDSTNWNTPQNVTIYGQDADEYDEGKLGLEEDYLSGLFHINAGITGISDDEKYSSLLIDNQSVSLWNTDNDTAGVVFASIDNNSKESGDNGTLEVRLRSRPYDNVTVSLSADNHTRLGETLGIKLVPDILTFTSSGIDNWTVPQTVQVVSFDDNFDEGNYSHDNQTFNVWLKSISVTAINDSSENDDRKYRDNLSQLRYQNLDFDNISLASLDNDTAGIVVGSIDNQSKESGDNGSFQVLLQSRPFGSLTVYLDADNASGTGIKLFPSTLNFDNSTGNWTAAQKVQVVSIEDSFDEGNFGEDNQTFDVWLDNVTNTGNDSQDAKYQVNLSALIVNQISYDNISLASLDNDSAGIVVASYDDFSSEDGSDNGSIELRLRSRPYDNITVHLKVLADNLSLTLNPDNLSFNHSSDNWSTPQTVLVLSNDDFVDEGNLGHDNQTFYIALDNVTNTGGNQNDSKYVDNVSKDGKIFFLESLVDNLTAYSRDNDTARIRMIVLDDNASESGDNASVQVVLESEPYHPVTIRITDNTSAFEKGIKFNHGVVPDNLTFGPDNWRDVQTFTLVAEDDQYDEGNFGPDNQTFLISVSSSFSDDSLYNAENATTRSDNVSILIEDNDTAGVVIVYSDNTSSEDGTDNGSLTVNLQSRPFDNLTVNLKVLASIQEHALQLIPSTLIFDNGSDNWSIPQQVKIVSIDDSVDEDSYGSDNQTFFLALDNITQTIPADAKYVDTVSANGKISLSGNLIDNLTAYSLDNDTMGVMVVATDNHSSENGTRGQLLVSLRSQPYDNVTLDFMADNGTWTFSNEQTTTGLRLSKDNATFSTTLPLVFAPSGNGNWNSAQTVWVESIIDHIDEGSLGHDNQTFNVWISQASVEINQKDTLYDNDSLVKSNISVNSIGAFQDNLTLVSTDNDTARVILTHADNTSSEAGDNGSFTIKLQTRPLDNVTIFFNDNDTSGRSLGLRFIPDNLTFTGQTDNWSTSRTVVFGSRDDQVDEGAKGFDNQTFTALVSNTISNDPLYNADNGTGISDNLSGLYALDNDTAGVVIVSTDNLSNENGTPGSLTVRLRSEPYGTVSLKLAADNDTRSLGGQNYALGVYLVPENLSFSHTSDNWSTPQTVVIHSFADDNDSVDEGELGPDNQSFTVWLSSIDDDNASGMLYDDIAQAKINLNSPGAEVDNFTVLSTDNDTARVLLAYGDNSSSESGSTGNFSIRLQTQPLNAVTVSFGDNDSSGRQLGLGFSPDNISFGPDNWTTSRTVVFSSLDDNVDEGAKGFDNQSFTALVKNTLSTDPRYNGENGTLVSDNLSGLYAEDNDTVGVVIVATDNRSYENGTTGTLLVKLRSEPYGNVNIDFLADNGSATLGSTNVLLGVYLVPDQLSFSYSSDNWSTAQTLTVHSFADDNDSVDEGARGADNQSFWVKLGSIDDDNASGMLYDDIAQAKINLNAIGDSYEVDNFTVISTDNDSSGLNVSTSSYAVSENASQNATLTLTLNSMPYGDVTVNLNTDNLTYGGYASPDRLVFGPDNWSQSATAIVRATDDFVDDGDDNGTDKTSFVITLDNTSSTASGDEKYNIGNITLTGSETGNITFNAIDNDTVGIRFVMIDNSSSESGDNASFSVRLNSAPWPGDNITLVLVDNDSLSLGLSLHPDRLNFDNTSWNIPQIVTVASQDDDVDEETRPGPDNQSFLVTVSSVSGGAKYGSLSEMSNYQGSADNLSFLSEDNDTRGIEIVLDDGSEIFIAGDNETTLDIVRDNLTISENGTQTQLVKIRLTSEPQANTNVKINTSNNFNQDIQVKISNSVQLTFTLLKAIGPRFKPLQSAQ